MQLSCLKDATQYLTELITGKPRVGIVLGTGLNSLIDQVEVSLAISYDSIPHFPVSTVEFHKGSLVFGKIADVPIVAMQGRFHYYEGYSLQEVTFPIRVLKELGIEFLLLSNAAGGMNMDYKKGDLVIIQDHLNLLPDNPLRGLGPEWGNRFVDMSEPYDPGLRQALEQVLQEEGLPVKKGIYVSVIGPSLETKAEYRWLRNTGADMVGMSTVPEVIVANQLGIKCAAISVITDECDPDNLKPINISEIIEVAGKADQKLTRVFCKVISKL